MLIGRSISEQIELDQEITQILGEESSGLSGANLAVALSCAIARAGACYKHQPLYLYLSDLYGTIPSVPNIMCNMLGGGGHHSNLMQITELMVLSSSKSPFPLLKMLDIWLNLYRALHAMGEKPIPGTEGCLVTEQLNDTNAIALLISETQKVFPQQPVLIGLDLAGVNTTPGFLYNLLEDYPEIHYLEDPYPIRNIHAYKKLLKEYPSKLVAGDDLTVGKNEFIENSLRQSIINTVVIKLNHVGTITRLAMSLKAAKALNAVTICSQRSQETARNTLSHIATAFAFDYLKSGAPVRERIANYSNLSVLNLFISNS